VYSLRSIREAIGLLVSPGHSAGVFGIRGSALAFLTASALKHGGGPFVVIHSDSESAASFDADLRFFTGAEGQESDPLHDRFVLYPDSERSPYTFTGYETELWAARLNVLLRLAEGRIPSVLTLALEGLTRKVLPREVIRRSALFLTVGQEMEREAMVQGLVHAGYSRAPLVEDFGDFSVRGFIVDIYAPQYRLPLRIEQVGDRIESIRFFDPSTQRSGAHISEAIIGPVHSVILEDGERQEGIKRLIALCEEKGVERKLRQRLVDEFEHGIKFPGADNFISLFYPRLESILDYLPPSAVIILPDAATLEKAFEELGEDVFRGWQSAAESGYPVPPPEDLYVNASAFKQSLKSFRTVVAGELEVIEPSRTSVRLSCVSNTDVRRDIEQATSHDAGMKNLVHKLRRWRDDGLEALIVSNTQGQANRLLHLLQPYKLRMDFVGEGFDSRLLDWDFVPGIRLLVGGLSSGFRLEDIGLVILTEEEIFGKRVRAPKTKRSSGAFLSSFTELSEGDAVVHEDYGIGIFRGLAQKEFEGQVGEVMVIEYAGGDLLYQPLHRLHVIQKYVAASEGPPMIDKLGGKGWEKTKARIKTSIKEMAAELLDIFAKRQIAHRKPYSPCFDDYAAFEASFEFEETPDQAKAIQDVMESMDSDVPMDRLVCGDVGYGKTEVALRAAFRAIMDGMQVAVLVPTTVLAQQHYETFKRRFSNYPVHVEMLSRFRAPKDQKIVLEGLKSGKVDLVVATHKLLQEHVTFKNLGLLVIDEEHRFGVAHKEKIKKYKSQIDVLTLTATPIPRTLNLSLSGIRDLSVIETPPADRKSIRTYVVRQSDEVIKEAIERELQRGGQVFFLHNRVQSIYRRASAIKAIVPHAAVVVAHGQMPNKELERVMVDFVKGKYNVLVCTSIIESGLDIPKANTIIIERADTFGLADLYQIRGRVGRSNARAYAYLLTPPESAMTADAIKRLAVIQDHSSLGQGFRIAMRDMEIRGAGNILGTSQSGHVSQVGYEMYLELLEEAVHELKGEPVAPRIDAEIHLRVTAQIPASYIPDPRQRMNFYRRLSKARGIQEIDEIEEEMVDLYGKEPPEVVQFIKIMHIRTLMCELRISRVDYNGRDLVLSFGEGTPIDPLRLVQWVQRDRNVRLLNEDKLAYRIGAAPDDARIEKCWDLLQLIRSTLLTPCSEGAEAGARKAAGGKN